MLCELKIRQADVVWVKNKCTVMCRAYVKTKKKELKLVFAKPYLFGSWFWSLLEILSPQTRVPSVTGISGNNWMLPWYLPVERPSAELQCAFDLTFFSFKRDLQLLYVKFMALQKNCFCFQDCVECFLQIVVLVCSFAGRTCQMWNGAMQGVCQSPW